MSIIWREPTNYFDNCYFCLANVKGFNKKNKHLLKYPDIPSAFRPIAYCDKILVPVFSELPKIDDDVICPTNFNTDDGELADVFLPFDEDFDTHLLIVN